MPLYGPSWRHLLFIFFFHKSTSDWDCMKLEFTHYQGFIEFCVWTLVYNPIHERQFVSVAMVVVSAEHIRPTQNLREIASLLDHKITKMTFMGLGWISIKHQFRNLYCRHEKQTILSSQCTFIYVFDQYMNTLNDQYDESYIYQATNAIFPPGSLHPWVSQYLIYQHQLF